jgi:uncharacterized protein (TIGR03790 family)
MIRTALMFATLLALLPAPARAQSAENVLVVINGDSPASTEVGEYYARARAIPEDQVVRIQAPLEETIDYNVFVRTIESPIATWITKRGLQDRILYIVLAKSVPIRIRGTGGRNGTVSSVDSELTLLYRKLVGSTTTVIGRTDNPYYLANAPVNEARRFTRFDADIYLVTRLDGYTVEDVLKLIDRGMSPSTEGRFVFDQRRSIVDRGGDSWLAEAAARLETSGAASRVVLESTREVAAVEGPVLGYYSWGSNDPSNRLRGSGLTFAPGALAGLFVSTDGRTFRQPPDEWRPGPSGAMPGMFGDGSQSMAADLIREGVTGVSAHVDEPFLDATARPQVLFPAYLAGFNLAESFYLSMPFLSWQTMVIGDPLCAPFQDAPIPPAELHGGDDPETGLPALFAERRLAQLDEGGMNREALVLLVRSQVLATREDDEGAEELMRQAVELEPRLTASSLQLAVLYESRGEFEAAIAQYRKVLAVDQKDAIALNNLAYLLASRESAFDEALPMARRAYGINPLPAIADTLAWIYHLKGDAASALPLIERAVAASPGTADIQLHAAFIFAADRQISRARSALDAAVKLNPGLAEREDVKELRSRIGGL